VRLPRSLMRKRRSERRAHPVARSQPQFQVFVVSADFKTNRKTRPRDPYRALARLLSGLGGVLAPTHQMRLLVSPYRAVKIRDGIKASILQRGGRVYVGNIARGSAWQSASYLECQAEKDSHNMGEGCRADGGGSGSSASSDIAFAPVVKHFIGLRFRTPRMLLPVVEQNRRGNGSAKAIGRAH
jgi:hypothetical protein